MLVTFNSSSVSASAFSLLFSNVDDLSTVFCFQNPVRQIQQHDFLLKDGVIEFIFLKVQVSAKINIEHLEEISIARTFQDVFEPEVSKRRSVSNYIFADHCSRRKGNPDSDILGIFYCYSTIPRFCNNLSSILKNYSNLPCWCLDKNCLILAHSNLIFPFHDFLDFQ